MSRWAISPFRVTQCHNTEQRNNAPCLVEIFIEMQWQEGISQNKLGLYSVLLIHIGEDASSGKYLELPPTTKYLSGAIGMSAIDRSPS